MGLPWYWVGIAVGLLCDLCGIAMVLPWHCCGIAGIAVSLLWDCCVICCEIAVVLPGAAVMLLWDCRGIVVQILR